MIRWELLATFWVREEEPWKPEVTEVGEKQSWGIIQEVESTSCGLSGWGEVW